jgi:hypothetical protein
MSIKKQFLLIVSFALVFTAYSQGGCLEYKSRLFVINIVNNGQPVKDSQLKLFLVNEDSLPYWNEPPNINNNTDGYTPRILRLNTMLNSRNLKNPYERQTFYPKLKETWYTCKIPTYSPDQSEKLYQVLIVNKKTKDSIYTYLPYAKSIEICAKIIHVKEISSLTTVVCLSQLLSTLLFEKQYPYHNILLSTYM